MSRKAEILDRKVVYDGYYHLQEVTFRHTTFAGGMSRPIKRVVLEVGEIAAGLIVKRQERRVVLIEQFRVPVLQHHDGWLIEVVAGRVDPGESAEQAFRRETLEEAGYEVENIQETHRFYTAGATLIEHMTLFCADAGNQVNNGGGTDDDEDIRVFEWSYDEFFAAIDRGEIVDAKTIIAGQWLRLNQA
jgi:nudix-type nucleoside diphosphatase (YffH/AdpP family)